MSNPHIHQRRLLPESLREIQELSKTNLVHYSPTPGLKTIDPSHQGSGVRSEEYRRGLPEVARSYFYREGTKPEDLVTGAARSKYKVSLKPHHKLYDLSTDEAAHVKDAVKENNGAWNTDMVLKRIRNAGYHGFFNSASNLPNVVALFHPSQVESEEPIGKSDLEKGVAQRLMPFNPQELPEDEEERVVRWQSGEPSEYDDEPPAMSEYREALDRLKGHGRERAFRKLMGATRWRKTSEGKREFLLHRGMSTEEHAGSHDKGVVHHDARTSWTPNISVARGFAAPVAQNGKAGRTASAWINEDNIVAVPKQYGQLLDPENQWLSTMDENGQMVKPKGVNKFSPEHEVVVESGHTSPQATKADIAPLKSGDINRVITARGGLGTPKMSDMTPQMIADHRAALRNRKP